MEVQPRLLSAAVSLITSWRYQVIVSSMSCCVGSSQQLFVDRLSDWMSSWLGQKRLTTTRFHRWRKCGNFRTSETRITAWGLYASLTGCRAQIIESWCYVKGEERVTYWGKKIEEDVVFMLCWNSPKPSLTHGVRPLFPIAVSSIHPWVVMILRYVPGQGIFLVIAPVRPWVWPLDYSRDAPTSYSFLKALLLF